MEKYVKPVEKGYKYLTGMKLIFMILTVLVLFLWKILSGKINLNTTHEISKDYKFSINELIERLDKIKHYILFIFIMSILVYFISKSNYKWELEYLKKIQEKEEEDENEDEDLQHENNSFSGKAKIYPKVVSPKKRGIGYLDIVGEEKEGDDESTIG